MMNFRNQLLIAVATVGVATTHANAQGDFYNRDKYEAVTDRTQPDFDPEPVRVGTFIVNSALNAGVAYNDNVLASKGDTPATAEQEDTIIDLGVDVNARTDWSNHEVGLRGRLNRSEYSDLSDESYTDLDIGGHGRLDVSRELSVRLDAGYEDSVLPRASYANSTQLDAPVEFTRSRVSLSASYQNERVQWRNSVTLTDSNFDDGTLRATGAEFDQDFRDAQDIGLVSRLSYAISPNVAVFGQGVLRQSDYDNEQVFVDPVTSVATSRTRDSEGYVVAAGVNFETNNLLRGDVAVGFFSEDKDDDAFEDVDGLSVDGRVQWFPSRLTTVEVNGARRVVDNGIFESPSTIQTAFGARVDHEFSRQIVGSLYGDLLTDEFQEIDRTDDFSQFGAAVTYKLNKRVHLTGSVQTSERDAGGNLGAFDPSFTANEIGLRLSIFP